MRSQLDFFKSIHLETEIIQNLTFYDKQNHESNMS